MTVEFCLTSSVVPSPGHQTRTSVEIDPGPLRFEQGLLVFLIPFSFFSPVSSSGPTRESQI